MNALRRIVQLTQFPLSKDYFICPIIQRNSLRLVYTLLPHKFIMNAGSDVIGPSHMKAVFRATKSLLWSNKMDFYSKEQGMLL